MSEISIWLTLIVCPRAALAAEILFLCKQLAFYQEHQVPPKRLTNAARLILVFWSRLCDWKDALMIVKPETLIRWHRQGFKLFWRWKSRAGRPRLPIKLRKLIVQMVEENPTWGQAGVADELSLKLGIQVSPRTVGPIGRLSRNAQVQEEAPPNIGRRLFAITRSPSLPVISWSPLQPDFGCCMSSL
jgi:hypothetical protein